MAQVTPPELRVLIVDDEAEIRDLLAAMLAEITDLRCVVREADDGTRAAEMLAEFAPQVMLVDLVMPRMNGLELAALARSHPATKATKIVLVTGFATVANITAAQSCGADKVLVKPIRVHVLLDLVRSLARQLGVLASAAT